MSLAMYWRRPPVPPEPEGVASAAKYTIATALFDGDGTTRESAILRKGDPMYHYLRGIAEAHVSDDIRSELRELLAFVDQYGAAEVYTDD